MSSEFPALYNSPNASRWPTRRIAIAALALSATSLFLSIEGRMAADGGDLPAPAPAPATRAGEAPLLAAGSAARIRKVEAWPDLGAAQRLVDGINAAHAPEKPPAVVESVFQEPGLPGFTGLVLRSENGGRAVGWMTPDGQHLVLGGLLSNAEGVNLSAKAFAERVGAEAAAKEDGHDPGETPDLRAALSGLSGFTVPASAPDSGTGTVYVFFDPLCPACKKLWGQVGRMAADKSLAVNVRWLPVVILGEDSERLVDKMLRMDEGSRHLLLEKGDMTPAPPSAGPDTDETAAHRRDETAAHRRKALAAYRQIAAAFPEGSPVGTPLLTWVADGGRIRASSGVPSSAEFDAMAKEARP